MSEEKTPSVLIKFWQWLEKIGIAIALLASLATIVLWWQSEKPHPEINAVITNSENLTNLPTVTGLGAKFTFQDRDVNDLWRTKITITNTGNETIISEGNNKNIIGDEILFTVPTDFEILNLQMDSNDFPCEVKQINAQTFSLKFLQWREKETLAIVLFLEKKTLESREPSINTPERILINGDILINNISSGQKITTSLLTRLTPDNAKTIQNILTVIFVIIDLFLLILLAAYLRDLFKFWKWIILYYSRFKKLVTSTLGDKAIFLLTLIKSGGSNQVFSKDFQIITEISENGAVTIDKKDLIGIKAKMRSNKIPYPPESIFGIPKESNITGYIIALLTVFFLIIFIFTTLSLLLV